MRLDATGPGCFRKALTWQGTQNTAQPQAATAAPQHDAAPCETRQQSRTVADRSCAAQPQPPLAEEPAGGPALDLRRPPNAAAARQTKRMRSDSDRCAVLPTRTGGRHRDDQRLNLRAVLPTKTASRQRDDQRLNLRAVVPTKTASRQRDKQRSTELRHPADPS